MTNPADTPLPIGHELIEGRAHHALAVYGTETCGDTRRTRVLLDTLGVQYNFYDTDKDAAMERTAAALQNGGQKVPVVDFGEGQVLVEPTDDELTQALRQADRLPHVVSNTV